MERPKKLQRVSLFTMALRHGLQKAHAELRLCEGEADPILAAELIDHRWFDGFMRKGVCPPNATPPREVYKSFLKEIIRGQWWQIIH